MSLTKAERIERWCVALESGDYKQCRGFLHNGAGIDEAHCCIGVLGEIEGPDWDEIDRGGIRPYREANELVGLKEKGDLIDMNDAGRTFTEIAVYIRKIAGTQ